MRPKLKNSKVTLTLNQPNPTICSISDDYQTVFWFMMNNHGLKLLWDELYKPGYTFEIVDQDKAVRFLLRVS
jgi:hypothetical protein